MDDSDIEGVEDTLTILEKYIDGLEIQGQEEALLDLMTSLYNEALDEHNYMIHLKRFVIKMLSSGNRFAFELIDQTQHLLLVIMVQVNQHYLMHFVLSIWKRF